MDAEDQRSPLVSVVIPCLNEAGNIARCVTAALHARMPEAAEEAA